MTVTLILIAVTVISSLMANKNYSLMDKMIFHPAIMKGNSGEWYRFIAAGFVHADLQHLFFNMFTLFFFGRAIEGVLGKSMFLILYFTALIVSSLFSYFKHQNDYNYRALGASGAVSAITFAYIIFAPWSPIYVYFIKVPAIVYGVLYLAYSAYMSKQGRDNIGHDAHLWGSVYGAIFVLITVPSALAYFLAELAHPKF